MSDSSSLNAVVYSIPVTISRGCKPTSLPLAVSTERMRHAHNHFEIPMQASSTSGSVFHVCFVFVVVFVLFFFPCSPFFLSLSLFAVVGGKGGFFFFLFHCLVIFV